MGKTLYNSFNDKQYEAITAPDDVPLMVIAGAGSGKTAVLTYRAVYLLNEKNYVSDRILGFTFTNKAANEMKERITKVIPNKSFKYIGTFHSLCLRILREDIKELEIGSINSNFSVIDEDDQTSILKEIYKLNNFDKQILNFKVCLSWISKLKSDDIYDANEIYEWLSFLDNTYDGKTKKDIFATAYDSYIKFLHDGNLLDFDDLIKYAKKVLQFDHIRSKWQNRFDYILVDEFQDTNIDQYQIIKLLSKNFKNIFAVGDPDQMIYSWRGAQENIFDVFRKDFSDSLTIVLEKNYRSTKNILNIANSLIQKNKNRIKKNLYTDSNTKSEIIYFEADDQNLESKFVCTRIQNLVDSELNKYDYKDIAILYRANYLSRNIEEFLSNYRIPYKVFGGYKFYQRKEVKDIIAYLKLIVNSDEVGLTRIYNTPRRQISEAAYFKIKNYAVIKNISTFAAFNLVDEIEGIQTRTKNAVKNFYQLITEIREKKYGSIADMIDDIVEKTQYYQMLKEDGEEHRVENIVELKNAATNFEQNNPGSNINFYLQELALLTSYDDDKDGENKNNCVTLMTVHASKGLEFKVVFIIQFNESIFPSIRSIEEGNLDEERRIAYVAITRAKENLYISCCKGTSFFGNREIEKEPSRFIDEIGDLLTEKRLVNRSHTKFNTDRRAYSSWNDKSKEKFHEEDKKFYVGELIVHDKFGEGIVLNIKGSTIDISFKNPQYGKKTFLKQHVAIRSLKDLKS